MSEHSSPNSEDRPSEENVTARSSFGPSAGYSCFPGVTLLIALDVSDDNESFVSNVIGSAIVVGAIVVLINLWRARRWLSGSEHRTDADFLPTSVAADHENRAGQGSGAGSHARQAPSDGESHVDLQPSAISHVISLLEDSRQSKPVWPHGTLPGSIGACSFVDCSTDSGARHISDEKRHRGWIRATDRCT